MTEWGRRPFARAVCQDSKYDPLRIVHKIVSLFKTIFKLSVVAVIVVIALPVISKVRQKSKAAETARDANYWSDAGFFQLQPEKANDPKVAVMAPQNCPSEMAQKARALCAAINAAGMPCEIRSQLALSADNLAEMERRQKFMDTVADPLVLVRGWGKGNPKVSEVIAQYRATAVK